jgi:hypothetical protein
MQLPPCLGPHFSKVAHDMAASLQNIKAAAEAKKDADN